MSRITRQTGEKILEWAKTGAEPTIVIPANTLKEGDEIHATLSPQSPKPTPPKEKLPPTVIQVMEYINDAKNMTALQTVYDAAFKYPWNAEDATTLADRYVGRACTLCWWLRKGDQVFDAGGQLVANVVKDERTGKRAIHKITPEEKAMEEAEKKGAVIASATAA